MPKTYTITMAQAAELAQARDGIQDKDVDKRLRSVQLRGEGKENQEIAEIVEANPDVVSRWVSKYARFGLETLLPKERIGQHRNISIEEEAKLLAEFEAKAEQGQIVEVSAIEEAYVALVGHNISSGQIYRVLKRHNWRKVKPRSRHPKSATPEAIEASKKLTLV